MLEARIVVLERSDLLDMGIKWSWPQILMGAFSSSDQHGGRSLQPNWPWGIQIGYTLGREFTNSLILTLNLLAENDRATVIASPQLMGMDGREAEIKVTTEEYFEITTEGAYVTSNLEKIETGTVLKIIPRIGENGGITLEMAIEVSNVVARGENNLPVVTRRTAKNTVCIKDEGTAILAGLMDSRHEINESWVPGIGRLPVLGKFFRSDASRNRSRQVAVFITAHVIPQKGEMPDGPPPNRPMLKLVGKNEFDKDLREALRRLKIER